MLHALTAFRRTQDPPLSQQQLADLLGYDRSTVTRWELGTRKIEPEDLPNISAKTGIPPAELRPDLAKLFASPVPERDGPARPRASARAKSRAA